MLDNVKTVLIYILRWEYVIGTLTVVATILQFLSGVLVCKQYVRNKTTGEATALPFLLGVLSCSMWYLYGTVKDDDTIIFVNLVGLILMLFYTIVFYKFALRSRDLNRQILSCIVFSILMYGYVFHDDNIYRQQRILGSVSCCLTLLSVGAPLVKLYYVIKVKSTECLPFQMILMSFFVSALWLVYGLIKADTFLIMPNIIGGGLAMCQLCLFIIYPNTPPPLNLGKTFQA